MLAFVRRLALREHLYLNLPKQLSENLEWQGVAGPNVSILWAPKHW